MQTKEHYLKQLKNYIRTSQEEPRIKRVLKNPTTFDGQNQL